jgi:hypothetical protein
MVERRRPRDGGTALPRETGAVTMTDHPTAAPDDGFPPSTGLGLPSLLFVALAAMLGVVLAVWILAASNAVWALVIAMFAALGGMLAVTAVTNRQLDDVDGSHPEADSSDEDCHDEAGR